jgi:hypothetical protein
MRDPSAICLLAFVDMNGQCPLNLCSLELSRFSQARRDESGASRMTSMLLFLAEFLEARIIPQGIEHGIEPEERRSERDGPGHCAKVRDRE